MEYNTNLYRYNSRRNIIFSKNGAVATSHPLAAQIGLNILQKGGNAVDAAIGTAGALTVFEPTSNGLGGDAFAILSINDEIYAINGSGKSPGNLSWKYLKDNNITSIPKLGWIPVTVPGIPRTWAFLHKRFGALSFDQLFSETIQYCLDGFPVSPTVSASWETFYNKYKSQLKTQCCKFWHDTFTIGGRPPKAGQIITLPDHAETLKRIGETCAEDFYIGSTADKILNFSKKTSGFFRQSDLAEFKPQWIFPISTCYKGYDILELPPNTHGIVTSTALEILSELERDGIYIISPKTHEESANNLHLEIEAIKLAFHETNEHIADIDYMKKSFYELLCEKNIKTISGRIDPVKASLLPDISNRSGTAYLACHDRHGNIVSYIQSNYMSFGSGIVIPGTGIALHNRGKGFNMIEGHPNCIDPGKRPYHTIIPGFIMKNNKPLGAFGVMGGFMQPQGHLQVILNLINSKMNPQEALDAPRWNWIRKNQVCFEQDYNKRLLKSLKSKKHDIKLLSDISLFGRGQIMLKHSDNTFCSGTEKRCDGHIASY